MIGFVARAIRAPVQLLHEATHVAAAAPWADEWAVIVGRQGAEPRMETVVEFEEGAPTLAIAGAHLAPFFSGLIGAGVAGLLLVSGGLDMPVTSWDLLIWSALAMAWTLYTLPSRADLEGALAALEGDDDG